MAKSLILTHGEIKQAIAAGADILSSLHNDLLKSDTSTGYVITKVTTAPKSSKIETIQDAAGVVFTKDGKTLLACSKPLGKEYIIPKKVRSIYNFAFRDNPEVETICLQAKIEKNGEGAWRNCPNLRAIVVDEDNPYFCSVDGVLYNKDKSCLIKYPINKEGAEFRVPSGVKEIAPCAFCCCKLTSVFIPSSTKTIAHEAFIYSRNLAHVEFSKGLVQIGKDAFKGTKEPCQRSVGDHEEAKRQGISKRTAERWNLIWIEKGMVTKENHGIYRKVA